MNDHVRSCKTRAYDGGTPTGARSYNNSGQDRTFTSILDDIQQWGFPDKANPDIKRSKYLGATGDLRS